MVRLFCMIIAVVFLTGCTATAQTDTETSVVVFTKTSAWRHDSIDAGVAMMRELGDEQGWSVHHTEDAGYLTAGRLSATDVVVFLNTTADVLDEPAREALQSFVEGGGGFVGIHSASDTEYGWEWYGDLVGAYFRSHPNNPNVSNADVIVERHDHPATEMLPEVWNRDDEWYNFDRNPRQNPDIVVLASLDESTYDAEPDPMGDHPIIWYREMGNGRSFYTGLGHTIESYAEPLFREHITGAIRWAAGVRD